MLKPSNETRAEIVRLCNEVVTTSAAIADAFSSGATPEESERLVPASAVEEYLVARNRLAKLVDAYELVDLVLAPEAPHVQAVIRGSHARRVRYGTAFVHPEQATGVASSPPPSTQK